MDVRRLFETNVVGLLAVTQAVFPHMAERGHGRVVNIGSVAGLLPTPFAGAYCATKSAVHMLSDVLRVELAPFGIDVMVVQPGRVRSSITENASAGLERFAAETSRFRAVFDHIVKRARASQVDPMETGDFAREVAMAMMADTSPRLLRAGGGSGSYAALSQLPRAVLDRVMTRRFGLAALRGVQ
jgi:NAD(P)-dependent dehydrogenase (short-subunit alcohol dehydrogenase family)